MSAAQNDLAAIHPLAPIVMPLLATVPRREIAERLQVKVTAIEYVVRCLRDRGVLEPGKRMITGERGPRARAERTHTLNCIRCRRTFQSWNRIKNRVCSPCKDSEDWW